jgi:hypothetical protein
MRMPTYREMELLDELVYRCVQDKAFLPMQVRRILEEYLSERFPETDYALGQDQKPEGECS